MGQNRPHILVFDSGVGGLSISHAILSKLPHCNISYLSDTVFFPYGTKSEQVLIPRIVSLLGQAAEQLKPDMIVVACNTASTLALKALRKALTLPVVGVVPAIKPAAQITLTKVIGLLATPGTIASPYTRQLITDFAHGCEVIPVGSSELVKFAEDRLRNKPIDHTSLNDIVAPFKANNNLDTVVLACTHFPLIRAALQKCLPGVSHWVDSGDAIARRVAQLLENSSNSLNNDYSDTTNHRYYDTDALACQNPPIYPGSNLNWNGAGQQLALTLTV